MSDDVRFHPELIDPTVFVAESARIFGNVRIGGESSVWFQTVIRGDTERIEIGAGTNIQDGCILHADPGLPCILGDRVTVGHGAIVHGALVEDDVLIGIRATVLNGATIGTGSLIAAGSLVTENMVIPAGSFVMGLPAKVVGPLPERLANKIRRAADRYIELARSYRSTAANGP